MILAVAPLCELLLRHRLSRAERPRDGSRPSLCDREEGVHDPLACEEGRVGRELPRDRPRRPDPPLAARGRRRRRPPEVFTFATTSLIVNLPSLISLSSPLTPGGIIILWETSWVSWTVPMISPGDDLVALLLRGDKVPFLLLVQCGDDETPADEVAALLPEDVERPLDAVVDRREEARAQLDREGLARVDDLLPRPHAGRVLVDLEGRGVALELDDLAHEAQVADPDDVEHPGAFEPLRGDDRPGYPDYSPFFHHALTLRSTPRTRLASLESDSSSRGRRVEGRHEDDEGHYRRLELLPGRRREALPDLVPGHYQAVFVRVEQVHQHLLRVLLPRDEGVLHAQQAVAEHQLPVPDDCYLAAVRG